MVALVLDKSTRAKASQSKPPPAQSDISEKEKLYHAKIDFDVREEAEATFDDLQDFVAQAFDKARWMPEGLSAEGKWILKRYASGVRKDQGQAEIQVLVQAIIARVMVEYSRRTYYFGWAEQDPIATAMRFAGILDEADDLNMKPWCKETRVLLDTINRENIQNAEIDLAKTMARHLKQILEKATTTLWKDMLTQNLMDLFLRAIRFFNTLHELEHATFVLEMPHFIGKGARKKFDVDTMEDADGIPDDEVSGQLLAVCAFPAVYRYDTASTDPRPVMTIVAKAKVLAHE